MDLDLPGTLQEANEIVRSVRPDLQIDTVCILVQTAAAGLLGFGPKDVRVGALYWPTGFPDDFDLAIRGGWGLAGVNHDRGEFYLDPSLMDDDGGYNGHAWIESEPGHALDVMYGWDGPENEMDEELKTVRRYLRREDLERQVKRFWRADIERVFTVATSRPGPVPSFGR
ncbi:conserved hypothetical protein [Hyphomicrobiales bacterium]|jgi:hypothetical protein|nr:conserved hypothetical protein [Hyphomicrobiales bacterium]CAH1702439.1 conserved hypothetical protein [Hyphomicrobiales bacterium]CAI0346639.1 conserved hypothetical protein [Hyphomicrobiales bacterium]